jgi:hypothetical protein
MQFGQVGSLDIPAEVKLTLLLRGISLELAKALRLMPIRLGAL